MELEDRVINHQFPMAFPQGWWVNKMLSTTSLAWILRKVRQWFQMTFSLDPHQHYSKTPKDSFDVIHILIIIFDVE
jgi:hypothetical protein